MDLQTLWFAAVAVLWTGFLLLEGFDFGVAALLPVLGRDAADRHLMLRSIGPLWDGNEVWLITAAGAVFAAFPGWYATLAPGAVPAVRDRAARADRAGGRLRVAALLARPAVGPHLDARHHRRLAGRRARRRRRARRDHPRACRSTRTAPGSAAASPGSAGRRCSARSRCSRFAVVHGALFLALKTDGDVRLPGPRRWRCAGRRWPRCPCWRGPASCTCARGRRSPRCCGWSSALAVVLTWARIRVDREGQAFAAWAAMLVAAAATIFGAAYPVVVPSTIDPAFDVTVSDASVSRLHADGDDVGGGGRAAGRARLPGLDLLGVPEAADRRSRSTRRSRWRCERSAPGPEGSARRAGRRPGSARRAASGRRWPRWARPSASCSWPPAWRRRWRGWPACRPGGRRLRCCWPPPVSRCGRSRATLGQIVAARDARRAEDRLRRTLLDRLAASPAAVAAAGGPGPAAVLATTRLHDLGPALATYLPALAQTLVVPPVVLLALARTDLLSAVLVGGHAAAGAAVHGAGRAAHPGGDGGLRPRAGPDRRARRRTGPRPAGAGRSRPGRRPGRGPGRGSARRTAAAPSRRCGSPSSPRWCSS